jgi:SagB-type dehydrogenase family enzyme
LDRFARNPDILIAWDAGRLLVEDLGNGEHVLVSSETLLLLDVFDRPRTLEGAVRLLPDFDRESVLRGCRQLVRLGLLIPEKEARRRRSRIRAWKENLASAYYHVASRDIRFPRSAAALERSIRRISEKRQPAFFKRYRAAPRQELPPVSATAAPAEGLERVLSSRRTVRHFAHEPAALDDFASVVRGTWGQTGWLHGSPFGSLPVKTSPSAGALHPIECYVIAWNVRGLARGLYHYDVGGDELRRLRSGNFSEAAVEAASGQHWVGRAAFLCVMTAVFERTLWKYGFESAYRVVWLDAGHLAQTFCLLATSRGLGPFTTAAIQDSYIEKLIGLDGIKEFPVYLCGAGVPAKKRSEKSERSASQTSL